jgi:DNA-binding response OmpR family regulator
MSNILLIEDDDILGMTLQENLILDGHIVTWIKRGSDFDKIDSIKQFDAVILDIMLPGKNGLEILSEIKKFNNVPVMVISAKGSPDDRVAGLELKADDYLPKPFHLKEFQLRLSRLITPNSSSLKHETIQIGNALIDFGAHTVSSGGHVHNLTLHEAKVLRFLVSHPKRVLSRDEIITSVWTIDEQPSSRTIDNFVVKFRKLIEYDPSKPVIIRSQRGLGYVFDPLNNAIGEEGDD